jgi:hypothetical protein
MYCSLTEAWPALYPDNKSEPIRSKNDDTVNVSEKDYIEFKKYIETRENSKEMNAKKYKNNIEHFEETGVKKYKNNIEHFENPKDDELKEEVHKYHKIHRDMDCDEMLDHIHNCKSCMKKMYMRYNCFGNKDNNIFSDMIKENKDIVTVVIIGIMIILILHLFKD